MMNKYKTFEELKEELGDKFEEYMYKANIELLTKIDRAINWCDRYMYTYGIKNNAQQRDELLRILGKGVDDE